MISKYSSHDLKNAKYLADLDRNSTRPILNDVDITNVEMYRDKRYHGWVSRKEETSDQ